MESMESKFVSPTFSPSAPTQCQQLPPPPPYSSTESCPPQGALYPVGSSQSDHQLPLSPLPPFTSPPQPLPQSPPPPPLPSISGIVPQSTVTNEPTRFGAYPQSVFCPACNQTVITETKYKVGIFTWLASASCSIIGLITLILFFPAKFAVFGALCYLLVPCFTDFTRDVEHSCIDCKRKLGLHRRI